MTDHEDDIYLLKKADIAAMKEVHKTHFLNTNAKRNNKSLGDKTGITGFGFHLIEVQPGHETTEHHFHYHEDECVYVLSGTATAYIGDQNHEIEAGDFIGYRKSGLPHSIKNTGSSPLTCLVVGERQHHDVGEYPKQQKRIYRHQGLPWHTVELDSIHDVEANVGKK